MSYYTLLLQTADDVTYTPDPAPPTNPRTDLHLAEKIQGVHAGIITKNGTTVHLTVVPASVEGEPPLIVLQFE